MADEEVTKFDGDTVDSDRSSDSGRVTLPGDDIVEHTFEDRYERVRILGQGGMGEVLLCRDRQIGRQVALKLMREQAKTRTHAKARFIREARVQGQLEHPSVVPVYDLGVGEGEVYFTMKRVRGDTVEKIVSGMCDGIAEFTSRYSRHRLLTSFASVCLAVDYAHKRGVMHRDLKPANIMLGDYGEVHVLDWGLARIGDPDPELGDSGNVSLSDPGETKQGALLGTPGYMSPEQTRGEHQELTPASDVYALGSVLYEILTYEPLFEPAPTLETMAATLLGTDARASVRAPKALVPPELEAICVKAVALAPEDRYQSARELHDELEHFLAGQRDTTLRQELAGQHAERASAAFERPDKGAEAIENRRTAMREIGRALALDPGNELAMEIMARLLSEPPETLPPEVESELLDATRVKARWTGKVGAFTFGSLFLYVPLFMWSNVADWTPLFLFYALALVTMGFSIWAAKVRRPPSWIVIATMLASNAMFTVLWAMFGSIVALPPILVANTVGFAVQLTGRERVLAVVVGCLCAVGPMVLEGMGVLEPSFHFEGNNLVIHWAMFAGRPLASMFLLGSISVGAVVTCTMSLSRIRGALDDSERQLFLYAWHLRELVPVKLRRATDPTVARRT